MIEKFKPGSVLRSWSGMGAFLWLQILLVLIGFVYSRQFEINFSFLKIGHFYFKNELYGYTFEIGVFGNNLTYLLQASKNDLRQYYPNYAGFIFIIGWIIRNVFPLVLAGAGMNFLWRKRLKTTLFLKNSFSVSQVPVFFIASLLTSLLFYYLLCPYSPNAVSFQILLARVFLGSNAIFIGISAWLARAYLAEAVQRFLFKPILPYSLALTRIIFFSYSIFLYLVIFKIGHGQNIGMLEKVGLPGIGWLVKITPVSYNIYSFMCYLGAFISLTIVVGYKTRFFLLLNSLVVFYVVASPNFFGKLWHEQIVIWISWILAASPCADVLSADARTKKGLMPEAKAQYGFHLRIIWLHFGIIYFFAGFYKLWVGGFDWALSDSIVSVVQIEWFENYDEVSSWRVDKMPNLLKAGGLFVIMFEMLYIGFLFSKKTRWISVFGGLAMHNFIGKVMYISFSVLLQAFYIVFIPWNWILMKSGVVSEKFKSNFERPNFDSLSIVLPLVVLGMNILYGVFRIDSYPFSIYPVYCDILPSTVKYFDYRIVDEDLARLNFREEGKKVNFRWEDFSRQEYHIIEKNEQGVRLDSARVRTMWKRWQLHVPSLSDVDSVDIYVVERPLDPDRANERLSENYLMSIYK